MAAKPDTLGPDIQRMARDIMAGKKDLLGVKVCTCIEYWPFSADIVILSDRIGQILYLKILAKHDVTQYNFLTKCLLMQVELED